MIRYFVLFAFGISSFLFAATTQSKQPQVRLVGQGLSAYFDLDDLRAHQDTQNREARLLGQEAPYSNVLMPYIGVSGKELLREQQINTMVIFRNKGFLEPKKSDSEFDQAKMHKKNVLIAVFLSKAIQKDTGLASEKSIRTVFERYYIAKTGKRIDEVPNDDLRQVIGALLHDVYRIYQKRLMMLPYWARKPIWAVTIDEMKEEAERDANTPQISAWKPSAFSSDPRERKLAVQTKLRENGYSEIYIFFDSLLNPAYRGAGNIDDILGAMGGFAAGGAPSSVPQPVTSGVYRSHR